MAAFIMICCGLAIAGIWTAGIIRGEKIDLKNGIFMARDPESDSLLLPHWIAEYGTACGLIIAGAGLITEQSWALHLAFLALGALTYTSINSLSWALAKTERFADAIPMLVSLAGAIISLVVLLS